MAKAKFEDVDSVDLSQLTGDNAVEFIGHHEDGRQISFAIDFIKTIGDYAYGMTFATQQDRVGEHTETVVSKLTLLLARVPLRGELTLGTTSVEIVPEGAFTNDPPLSDYDAVEATAWQELPVEFDSLRLVTYEAA